MRLMRDLDLIFLPSNTLNNNTNTRKGFYMLTRFFLSGFTVNACILAMSLVLGGMEPEQLSQEERNNYLAHAAEKGDLHACESALAANAHVNSCDEHGDTALHNAVRTGRLRIVQLLLGRGASVNARGWKGLTPLGAFLEGSAGGQAPEIMRELLNHGAVLDPDRAGEHYDRIAVLSQALRAATLSAERGMIELLLREGATHNVSPRPSRAHPVEQAPGRQFARNGHQPPAQRARCELSSLSQ
jgi:hypothetical protein